MKHLQLRWHSVIVALGFAAALLYAHEGHQAPPSRGAKVDLVKGTITLSAESRSALGVEAAPIGQQPLPDAFLAPVTISSPWQNRAVGSARLTGRITAVHARPGEAVEAGQVLAEVASLELEALQAEMLAAQTELTQAEKLLAAYQATAVSEQTLLDIDNKITQARNELEADRAKWLSLGLSDQQLAALRADPRQRVAGLQVKSPIRGTLERAEFGVGKVVEPGEQLFEVVDLSSVWLNVGILERDLSQVFVGQKFDFTLTAWPGEVFHGVVQTVGQTLDPETHLNAVWTTLENPTGAMPRFLPGMNGQARLFRKISQSVKVVPSASLINNGLSQFVLVEEVKAAKQSELRRRDVAVVRQSPQWVEVQSSDLLPGDQVVSQGAAELGAYFIPEILKLSPEASRTNGLELAPVGRWPIDSIAGFDAEVEIPADRRTNASSTLPGTLLRVHAERGQTVKAGNVIAEIASLELNKLQWEFLREHLQLSLLEQQGQRLTKAGDAVQRRRVLEWESNLVSSRLRRDSLMRQLELVGLTKDQIVSLTSTRRFIETLSIRAPADGVVVGLQKELGQAVRAEEPIISIHNPSQVLVRGFASEANIQRVKIGQPARVRLVAEPGKILPGRVIRISPTLVPQEQSISLWVEFVPPPASTLRHAQLASVTVSTEIHAPTLAAPVSAIAREGSRSFVFVRMPDGTFDRRAVETGRADDRHVEIVSGLVEGETIAIKGIAGLQTAYAVIR